MILPGKIISGGQTGVDRAALDFAKERGVERGGWAPRGWRSEDGGIPAEYRADMREHNSADYLARTEENVREADATLIVACRRVRDYRGDLTGGTARTARFADGWKPLLIVDHDAWERTAEIARVREWLMRVANGDPCIVLNIAGPRESKAPGIYQATLALLREVWP